jgi:hypothetical protein
MRLLRIGKRGSERPAILDEDGIARDLSGLVADFGPGFFADGGLTAGRYTLLDTSAADALLPAACFPSPTRRSPAC